MKIKVADELELTVEFFDQISGGLPFKYARVSAYDTSMDDGYSGNFEIPISTFYNMFVLEEEEAA